MLCILLFFQKFCDESVQKKEIRVTSSSFLKDFSIGFTVKIQKQF
jgi:hypothetical protein